MDSFTDAKHGRGASKEESELKSALENAQLGEETTLLQHEREDSASDNAGPKIPEIGSYAAPMRNYVPRNAWQPGEIRNFDVAEHSKRETRIGFAAEGAGASTRDGEAETGVGGDEGPVEEGGGGGAETTKQNRRKGQCRMS